MDLICIPLITYFYMLTGHFLCFLFEIPVAFFINFLWGYLFHFLDILNINGFLFICMTDILSQFSGLSFPSPWRSFDEKRVLISISKSLFFHILHGYLRNSPLLQGHKDTALYIVT